MLAVLQLVVNTHFGERGHLDRRDVHRVVVDDQHAVSLGGVAHATVLEFLCRLGLRNLVWSVVIRVNGVLVDCWGIFIVSMLRQHFRTQLAALHFLQIFKLFPVDLGLERYFLLGAGLSFGEPCLDFPLAVEIVQGQNVSLFRTFVEISVDLGFIDGCGHFVHSIPTPSLLVGKIDSSEGFVVTGGLRFRSLLFLAVFVACFHGLMGRDRPRLAASELFRGVCRLSVCQLEVAAVGTQGGLCRHRGGIGV